MEKDKQKQYQFRKVPQRMLPRAPKPPNDNPKLSNNDSQKSHQILEAKVDASAKMEERVNLLKIQTVRKPTKNSNANTNANANAKGNANGKENGKGAMKLGAGFMGSVFSPPLPCQNAELDRLVREISKITPLVLKHTELAMGLTAVHTGNYIRQRWLKLKHQPFSAGMSLAVWKLLGLIRSGKRTTILIYRSLKCAPIA